MAKKPCQQCHLVCGKGKVPPEVVKELEDAFQNFEKQESNSLLKKHLTKDIVCCLRDVQTPMGSTLMDCIRSGLENLDSGVGIYCPDADAYTVFADLFDPIIEEYHMGFKKTAKHPPLDWGNPGALGDVDPSGKFVVSTRVRCGRALVGYPFAPKLTETQYREMEGKILDALQTLKGEQKGTYHSLCGMDKECQQKLIDDHYLFKEGDRFLQAANACRFWPIGRGIYYNDEKSFLVWVNEEDHLRIISMEKGGNVCRIYNRLMEGVTQLCKKLQFSRHSRLGFLTFCPTNLGTTIRASVHIKLRKLASDKKKLEEVAAKYSLQVRGTSGEHSESIDDTYDISNKRRMGLTEFEAVKEMCDGIREMIKIEQSM